VQAIPQAGKHVLRKSTPCEGLCVCAQISRVGKEQCAIHYRAIYRAVRDRGFALIRDEAAT